MMTRQTVLAVKQNINQVLKKSILLLLLPLVILSCNLAKEKTDKKPDASHPDYLTNTTLELIPKHQAAFDALNTLQVNTDARNRLYSTFANIDHPCFPPDTSFVISQSELLIAMRKFVDDNCKRLSVEERNELAEASVLAQEEYKVLHCRDDWIKEDYDKGLSYTGTWIMPNILGRTDLTLVW